MLRYKTTSAQDGFTIVELLVSIAIIGVLIGITAPALFRVKTSAGQMQSLANLHNLALSLQVYAEENNLRWPFPPKAIHYEDSYGPVAWNPSGLLTDPYLVIMYFSPIWSMDIFWTGVMHKAAPWPENYESWLSPGRLDSIPEDGSLFQVTVSYRYSNSFLASPHVWSGSADVTEADIGPTRTTDVAHPSNKVIMFDIDRSYLRNAPTPVDPRPLLFIDGSAFARRDTDATPGAPNPLHGGATALYHNTPDGVLGRDF